MMLVALSVVLLSAVIVAVILGLRYLSKTAAGQRRVIADMISAGGNTPETRLQIAKLTGERHGFLFGIMLHGAKVGAIWGVVIAIGYLVVDAFVH